VAGGRCPGQGGERREREGERKWLGFKLFFSKFQNGNLKNFEHGEFKNLQLLFWIKVHLSFSLEVI
jgi:hypothetical protein